MSDLQNQAPLPNEKSHPPLKAVIRIILLTFLLIFLLVLLGSVLGLTIPRGAQLILGEIGLIGPGLIYLYRKNYNLQAVLRLNKVETRVLLTAVLIGVSLPVLSAELDNLVSQVMKLPDELKDPLAELLIADSWTDWFSLILATVVLASLIEEMLFRGLLQKALEAQFEPAYAVFLSALIFAIFHGPIWMVQVAVIGVLFGYIAWRSQSIFPGVVVHALHNLFSLIWTNVAQPESLWNLAFDWRGHVHPTLLAVAACLIFYAIRWFDSLTSAAREN